MDVIEVTARFEVDGRVVPLSFVWQGRNYPADCGRRWEEEGQLHILALTQTEGVVELIFKPEERKWYLRRLTRSQTV